MTWLEVTRDSTSLTHNSTRDLDLVTLDMSQCTQDSGLGPRDSRLDLGLGLSDSATALLISTGLYASASRLLRLCNMNVSMLTVLHCYRIMWGIVHCISLAFISRLSRFPSSAVGTSWPFCVDVPLNNQSIYASAGKLWNHERPVWL